MTSKLGRTTFPRYSQSSSEARYYDPKPPVSDRCAGHGREANGAGLRPHCPVDAAPRTSLRRSQQNHQRAPEFRIGRSTPRRAIRPTKLPPEPEEQADSERMSHRAHMGLCRRVGSRRRPSVHLPCFSSAATYRSPGGSDGIGLQYVGSNSTSTLAVDIQRP
jgi:hypothetical protein